VLKDSTMDNRTKHAASGSPEPMAVFSDGLASLRGLAAAIVVVFHSLLVFRLGGVDNPHVLQFDASNDSLVVQHILIGLFNGPAAVVLFFVLSGTVLSLSLARRKSLRWQSALEFYCRRVFRLFPLLAIVALASGLADKAYFKDVVYDFTTSWMDMHFKSDASLREVVRNAVGVSSSLNPPTWTITVEIAASLAFPLLYWVSTRSLLVVTFFGLALITLMFVPGLSARHIETFLFAFYLGALIPRWGAALTHRFFRLEVAVRWFIISAILLLAMSVERLCAPTAFADPVPVLVVTLCAAALVAIVYFGQRSGVLGWRGLIFLGEISYGLYLIHTLVLFTLAHKIAPALEGSLTVGEALALNFGLAIATLALTVPIATFAHYAFERPYQRLGQELGMLISGARDLSDIVALCMGRKVERRVHRYVTVISRRSKPGT
jgi:peptidoglycan/LPS O-acetylase OafA/YrhL